MLIRRSALRRLCVALPFLLLTGCGSPAVTKAQADRVRLGMSISEVEGILGKGKGVEPGEVDRLVKSGSEQGESAPAGAPKMQIDTHELRGIRWGSDKKSVTVIFQNDRVFRVFTQGL